ncbi:MAG: hypothetical protein ACP5OC_08100 [Thermoplasmata archaeon]
MAKQMDIEEKLKIMEMGGCWFSEESNAAYDTYESLRRHEIGPYRYICSREIEITDSGKYEFFNEETKKGYLIPGGCWISPSTRRAYDSLEECSKFHDDCGCTCANDYRKALEIQGEIPNMKSKVARVRKRDDRGRFV